MILSWPENTAECSGVCHVALQDASIKGRRIKSEVGLVPFTGAWSGMPTRVAIHPLMGPV